MPDRDKSKTQLIAELAAARGRIAELEEVAGQCHQLEEALRESEWKYRALLASIEEGYYEVDLAGNLLFFNEALRHLIGYPADQLQGMNNRQFMDEATARNVYRIFNGVYRTGEPVKAFTGAIIRPDGSHRLIEISVSLVRDASGQPVGFRGLARDITEQVQAADALRESEEKYRQLFEMISDAIFLIDNETGQIYEANPAASDIYGYSHTELLQRKNTDLSAEPERTRQTVQAGISRVPIRYHRKKDGTLVIVEIAGRYFTWQGREVHVAAIRDITERVRAEEALRRSEEAARQLQEALKALHHISLELAKADTLEALYRGAVELGCRELGFDRLGLFLFDEETGVVSGTFGIDKTGQLQDLRGYQTSLSPDAQDMVPEAMRHKTRVAVREGPLRDVSGVVGHGWNALALLWQGDRSIGWLSADNLLRQQPLQDYQLEVLSLYGTILGHLAARQQAEAERRASEERYRHIIESTPLGMHMYRLEPDGRLIFVGANPAADAILGVDNRQFVGRTIEEAFPLLRHSEVPERYRQAAGHGIPWQAARIVYEDEPIAGVFEVWAFQTSPGEMTAAFLDITERVRAEETLRESEERFRLAFENANTGMCLVSLDGHLLRVNSMMSDIFGYSREELESMTVNDIAHPEDLDTSPQFIRKALAGTIDSGRFEKRYRHKQGHIIWGQVSSSLVRDSQGNPLYFISQVQDITEQKQAEAALQASERKLRRVIEQSYDGISLADETGTMVEWNRGQENIMGLSRDEVLGRPIWDVLFQLRRDEIKTPEEWELLREEMLHLLQTGEAPWVNKVSEVTVQRPDGQRRVVQSAIFPVPTDQGFMVATLSRDITEQKKAEERELVRAIERERMEVLDRFIGDASHDLKTPITSMKFSLAVVKEASDMETRQRHLRILDLQIAHVEKLLEDLLSLSRLEKITEIVLRSLDLNTVAQAVMEEHRALALQQQHTLTFSPHAEPLPVQADSDKIKRAVGCLVVNALNYTPAGGHIAIRTYAQEAQAVVEVQDDGIGISAADLPHIFERFFRADAARNTNRGGMGLGLSIADKIVQAHHGRIEVESTPGAGSTFRILLPLS